LATNIKGSPQRADITVRKAEAAREGAKAMREYEAARVATLAKTAKLKALRLAKEAEASDSEKV